MKTREERRDRRSRGIRSCSHGGHAATATSAAATASTSASVSSGTHGTHAASAAQTRPPGTTDRRGIAVGRLLGDRQRIVDRGRPRRPPRVVPGRDHGRGTGDAEVEHVVGMIGRCHAGAAAPPDSAGRSPPAGRFAPSSGELQAQPRRFELAHPEVLAHVDVDVLPGHAVHPGPAPNAGEVRVASRPRPRHRFRRDSSSGRTSTPSPRPVGRPGRAMGLGGVFDDRETDAGSGPRSTGRPYRCTGTMALVPPVIASPARARIDGGRRRVHVDRHRSRPDRGDRRSRRTAVKAGTITSSPAEIRHGDRARGWIAPLRRSTRRSRGPAPRSTQRGLRARTSPAPGRGGGSCPTANHTADGLDVRLFAA